MPKTVNATTIKDVTSLLPHQEPPHLETCVPATWKPLSLPLGNPRPPHLETYVSPALQSWWWPGSPHLGFARSFFQEMDQNETKEEQK